MPQFSQNENDDDIVQDHHFSSSSSSTTVQLSAPLLAHSSSSSSATNTNVYTNFEQFHPFDDPFVSKYLWFYFQFGIIPRRGKYRSLYSKAVPFLLFFFIVSATASQLIFDWKVVGLGTTFKRNVYFILWMVSTFVSFLVCYYLLNKYKVFFRARYLFSKISNRPFNPLELDPQLDFYFRRYVVAANYFLLFTISVITFFVLFDFFTLYQQSHQNSTPFTFAFLLLASFFGLFVTMPCVHLFIVFAIYVGYILTDFSKNLEVGDQTSLQFHHIIVVHSLIKEFLETTSFIWSGYVIVLLIFSAQQLFRALISGVTFFSMAPYIYIVVSFFFATAFINEKCLLVIRYVISYRSDISKKIIQEPDRRNVAKLDALVHQVDSFVNFLILADSEFGFTIFGYRLTKNDIYRIVIAIVTLSNAIQSYES